MATGWASSIAARIAAKSRWLIASILAVTAAILLLAGRSAICPCGRIRLWWGAVQSEENSQQLTDWYSVSHVIHGFLFYAVGWFILRHWPWRARLVVAALFESGWEILENSPLIIDRYRAVTMAFGYRGDSVLNSLSDIACMMLGFVAARWLPVRATVATAIVFELLTLAVIRDNLTLNILMLVHPVNAIRLWQAAG